MTQAPPSNVSKRPAAAKSRFFFIWNSGLITVGVIVLLVIVVWYGCFFGSMGVALVMNYFGQRNTPLPVLHVATVAGDTKGIQRRLQSGDSVDLKVFGSPKWPDGTTPLMIAVSQDDVASTQMLLDHGASLDVTNDYGESAVHMASARTMEILLQRGADINARTIHGQTPLMEAAIRARATKDLSVVRVLLDSGADVNVRDNQGYTAISVLRTWPDPDPAAIKMIEEAGGK